MKCFKTSLIIFPQFSDTKTRYAYISRFLFPLESIVDAKEVYGHWIPLF